MPKGTAKRLGVENRISTGTMSEKKELDAPERGVDMERREQNCHNETSREGISARGSTSRPLDSVRNRPSTFGEKDKLITL